LITLGRIGRCFCGRFGVNYALNSHSFLQNI
jgi:hypothetical protein